MGIQKFGEVVMIHLSDIDSNIYVIGDTVIDTGTGFNYTRLRDIMKVMKIDMSKINWIINTHCHFDHTGGNGYFLNAKIAAHSIDANIIESADKDLSAAEFFDGNPNPKTVDKKLKDGDKLKAGKLELDVIHTPGHTSGSICLYEKKGQLLFSGDTLFENSIGRVDFSNSDPAGMQDSLQKLSKLKVKKVLPGHGAAFDKAKLDKVLKTNVMQFQKQIEEGEIDDDYV